MNELALFAGAGGGILAAKLLGHRMIGYVEYNEHCQKVIRQRIDDGIIDEAPIFGDIRAFNSEGYAESYQGMADVISAGFPCQPFSVCGHQFGENDPRNMWPSTIQAIRIIRPRFAYLENVPGLLVSGYIKRIFGDLAESGYDARWCVLGNHHIGGVSDGKRLWIVAAASDCTVLESMDILKHFIPCEKESCGREYTRAIRAGLQQNDYTSFKRNSDEVAVGMERLKAIGNGQNPILAATAFKILQPKLVQ